MTPSFSIHFKNGIPPQEERNRIRMDIERQTVRGKQRGEVYRHVLRRSRKEARLRAVPIVRRSQSIPIPLRRGDREDYGRSPRYERRRCSGSAVPGKLGGGGELAEAAELFEQNVVRPNRRIVEETVQTLLRAAGLDSAVLE